MKMILNRIPLTVDGKSFHSMAQFEVNNDQITFDLVRHGVSYYNTTFSLPYGYLGMINHLLNKRNAENEVRTIIKEIESDTLHILHENIIDN